MKRITVIGDGGWGTALAMVLLQNGRDVSIWGPFPEYLDEMARTRVNRKFLDGVELPPNLAFTADPKAAVQADGLVLAVPSRFYRSVCATFAPLIRKEQRVLSVSKGLDAESHARLSTVAEDVLGLRPAAVLSGPSHAEEVARSAPTAVTIACDDHDAAVAWQEAFNNMTFRVYTATDVIGVEIGGAMKNVIAIAAGICDGLGFGDNTKAALMTRGLAEIARLGTAMGGLRETFSGLSGIGDLMVTCMSRHSRNRGLGEEIGKGRTLEDILAGTEKVAEGVWTSELAVKLAADLGVTMPVAQEVYDVVHQGKNPLEAVTSLLSRDPKPE